MSNTIIQWLNKHRKNLLVSILIILTGVLSFTSTLDTILGKTIISRIDEKGSLYFKETMSRALYTYAVARGLNGVISVIQGTNIAVSPAGVGVSLSIGEILDPVNDLVERFSWIMLMSITSLGIQKVFMEIGNWFGFNILLSFAMTMILLGIWINNFTKINLKNSGYRLVILALAIRFCIPASAIVNDKIYELFLKDKYENSIESLEKADQEIKDTGLAASENGAEEDETSYLSRLKELYNTTKEYKQYKEKIMILKDKISDYTEYTVDLIILFILQTIIIPLMVLWGFAKVLHMANQTVL
ncbi:Uncharacterized protein dnl_31730 [Desulfonema limicola]|uniref:Uncharacterized protein n=1 Tax=Desulfonema limicola TaxID=45656 RepID=A0A975B8R4_9BACT|nr:hypothetical protein [Desulfonema limicola]QTA80860.1 Uncharacterized protein dnl_31730 [Desulfonema limicola]